MFSYPKAFARNLGWVTEAEQETLRGKRVAVAGLGGVGGAHVLTLARLGIGALNLADFDEFEIQNFNRQAGATIDSIGQPKLDVMSAMAHAINPEIDIRNFGEGVSSENAEDFLEGVDLYIDGLDFFVFETRQRIFALCAKRGIPALTVAPLGMGAALLVFLPGQMSFEQYFQMGSRPEPEKAARFLAGLSPSMLQLGYLVDPSRVDLVNRTGPSTVMACELCAGVASTEALKILLGRGRIFAAPWGIHFDAYKNKLRRTWRPGGNSHPLQRALIALARRRFSTAISPPVETTSSSRLDAILDLARWAPSGDNSQPWRFETVAPDHVIVHAFDTRHRCVYDLEGHASQLSVGAMLETMRIAATAQGCTLRVERRRDSPDESPLIDAWLQDSPGVCVDPLHGVIRQRSVQRRPLRTRPLEAEGKRELEQSVGSGFRVIWWESWRDRLRLAWLATRSAKIRLTIPEAYAVHREIIEWHARYSEDRVPDQALGADALTVAMMRWVLSSWPRVQATNRYFGGTLAPRLQLDLLPGLRCAAHFAIVAEKTPTDIDDQFSSGAAVQRFWLTATRLGLQLQPQYTPLVFAGYARTGLPFTRVEAARRRAARVASMLTGLLGGDDERAVFLGRVGYGPSAEARSLRLPLDRLRWTAK